MTIGTSTWACSPFLQGLRFLSGGHRITGSVLSRTPFGQNQAIRFPFIPSAQICTDVISPEARMLWKNSPPSTESLIGLESWMPSQLHTKFCAYVQFSGLGTYFQILKCLWPRKKKFLKLSSCLITPCFKALPSWFWHLIFALKLREFLKARPLL